MTERITYGRLRQLLLDLSFQDVPTKEKWKAYRHEGTDTIILLADRKSSQVAREPDILSIRRHLADNGIVDEQQFERMIANVA
jgi:hypothetical protein